MADPQTQLKSVPLAKRRYRHRDSSWASLRRHVLQSIGAAATGGHKEFLCRTGVTYEVAQRVAFLDPSVLNDLANDQESQSIRISIDDEQLRLEIQANIPSIENRQLALELLAAGATRDMVKDFQLVDTNAEIKSLRCVARQGELQIGGSPAKLTDKQIRACHDLWRLRVEPESVHPIRHLSHTAQYLNLPAVSIWMYLNEAQSTDPIREGDCWASQFPWILTLYPRWHSLGERHD